MKTRTSWLALFLQLIGYLGLLFGIIPLIILFPFGYLIEGTKPRLNEDELTLFGLAIGWGVTCVAWGNIIQKTWNMEAYLEILAKNSIQNDFEQKKVPIPSKPKNVKGLQTTLEASDISSKKPKSKGLGGPL